MDKQEQIEEMAKLIRPILENRTDICFIPYLDKPIAEELLKHYQPKTHKYSVVLTKKELDNLWVCAGNKYSVLDKAREVARKETAKEFAEKIKQAICDNTYPYFDKDGKPVNIWNSDGFDKIDELVKEYEVEND